MAPQQKRSQQYDWFKGPAAKGGPKDRKSQAKKVWKFTKIFIYLALFVFSMTGCIQSLILKTTNYVGTGVEFYANRDEVAPHVSKLDITHTAKIPAQGTTAEVPEIYTLSAPATNIWLSKDVQPKSGSGFASLADVHTAVSTQSSTHMDGKKGTLRLEDAFKGSNEAVWISPATDKAGAEFPGVSTDGTNPFVLSSLADQSAFDNTAVDKNTKFFDGIPYYDQAKDGSYTRGVLSGSLHSFNVNPDYIKAKLTALNKIVSGVTGTTVDALFTSAEAKANALADATAKAKATSAIKSLHISYNRDLTRQAYSFAVLEKVLTKEVKGWLIAGPELSTIKAKPAANADAATVKAYQASLDAFIAQVKPRMTFLNSLQDIFKLSLFDSADVTKGFVFTAGQYPFFSGSTNWRPLVTWGDAWSEGPFYGLFVYPTAYVSANMIAAFPGGMAGWETLITIFVVVFSMRFLAFLLSFKATMQQTRMQELAAKKAIIDAKYAPYKGNKQMENRQRQEVSEMYKKQGVSPFGSMTSIFITMPLFLAIWRTIGALPHIKSTVWLGINFSATSWRELFHGSFQYLPLMILAAGFAAFQQILPRLLTKRRDRTRINVQQKAAMKKGNKTQNIMMLVFVFMSLIFSAGLQVYWIAGGVWMTIQSTLTHFLIIRQSKNKKRNRIKT